MANESVGQEQVLLHQLPFWDLFHRHKRKNYLFLCKTWLKLRPPHIMIANFSPDSAIGVLQRFLCLFDLAAVAHARDDLSEEQKAAIAAFARSGLREPERQGLISLLAHNTAAMEHLAALLRVEPVEEK